MCKSKQQAIYWIPRGPFSLYSFCWEHLLICLYVVQKCWGCGIFFFPSPWRERSSASSGIQLPAGISGPLRLVLFIWHLSSCFISAWSLFPLSPFKDQCLRLTGHCYIPTYLFSSTLSLSLPYANSGKDLFCFYPSRNRFRFRLGNNIHADTASFLPQGCNVLNYNHAFSFWMTLDSGKNNSLIKEGFTYHQLVGDLQPSLPSVCDLSIHVTEVEL